MEIKVLTIQIYESISLSVTEKYETGKPSSKMIDAHRDAESNQIIVIFALLILKYV